MSDDRCLHGTSILIIALATHPASTAGSQELCSCGGCHVIDTSSNVVELINIFIFIHHNGRNTNKQEEKITKQKKEKSE